MKTKWVLERNQKQIKIDPNMRKSDICIEFNGIHDHCLTWSMDAPGRPKKLTARISNRIIYTFWTRATWRTVEIPLPSYILQ